MKNKIQYYLLVGFMSVVRRLPFKMRYKIADFFGLLAYLVLKKRRRVTYLNIKMAFPNYDEKKIKKTVKESYKNMTESFFEVFWLDEIKYEIFGLENINRALEEGNGLIAVSLHFGNWELTGTSLAKCGLKTNVVAKKQRNQYIDALINRIRESSGMKIIPKGKSFRSIIKIIKENGILGLISDQYSKDVKVNFFGKETWAVEGPVRLAVKLGVPAIMTYSVKNRDKSYNVYVSERLKLKNTGNTNKDIEDNAQLIINEMEKIIKENPEQWFWQHKRWKNTIDYS